MQRQGTRTEQQIRNEFQKLYQFLQFEEAGRLLALRQEEEQKIQMLEEKLEEINSDMSSLLKVIRVIEEDMWTEDLLFIQVNSSYCAPMLLANTHVSSFVVLGETSSTTPETLVST